MGISGRANGKAPLCMAESVTPKGREGLTEACADWNPVQILGCVRLTGKFLDWRKFGRTSRN